MSMMMGYHYQSPKRGEGVSFAVVDEETNRTVFFIASCTKASANELKREFKQQGYKNNEICIEKN